MTTSGGQATALSLYRSLLRTHSRCLPPEMRSLGDAYVKSEFRQHVSVTDEDRLSEFFRQWQAYRDDLLQSSRERAALTAGLGLQPPLPLNSPGSGEQGAGRTTIGKDLPDDLDLSKDQKLNLDKLKREATKAAVTNVRSEK